MDGASNYITFSFDFTLILTNSHPNAKTYPRQVRKLQNQKDINKY